MKQSDYEKFSVECDGNHEKLMRN